MGIGTGGVGQKATAGGVPTTPEQLALAQYDFGQGVVGAQHKFAEIPHSTNLTQAIGGARFKEAEDIGRMSQANTQAITNFINQQAGALTGGIGSLLGAISGGGSNTGLTTGGGM